METENELIAKIPLSEKIEIFAQTNPGESFNKAKANVAKQSGPRCAGVYFEQKNTSVQKAGEELVAHELKKILNNFVKKQ
jgi:hypothetical protein